jgi:hypothetical protein
MKIADIYLRVSSEPQVKGDGLRRQEEICRQWCLKHNARVRNVIVDICSAWQFENFEVGSLSVKIDQWRKYHWQKRGEPLTTEECPRKVKAERAPDYLVFENMDRLTRGEPSKVIILIILMTSYIPCMVEAIRNFRITKDTISGLQLTKQKQNLIVTQNGLSHLVVDAFKSES